MEPTNFVQFLVDSGATLDVIDAFLQTPWSIAEGIIGAGIVNFNKKPSGPHPEYGETASRTGLRSHGRSRAAGQVQTLGVSDVIIPG